MMKGGLELHMFTIIFSPNPFILFTGYVSVHRSNSVMDGWLAPLLWTGDQAERDKIIKGRERDRRNRKQEESKKKFEYSHILYYGKDTGKDKRKANRPTHKFAWF